MNYVYVMYEEYEKNAILGAYFILYHIAALERGIVFDSVLAYSVKCIKLVNGIAKDKRTPHATRHRPIKTPSNLLSERDSHCIGQL